MGMFLESERNPGRDGFRLLVTNSTRDPEAGMWIEGKSPHPHQAACPLCLK